MFFSNGRNVALATRDVINSFNARLNRVTDSEVSLRSPIAQAKRSATDILRNFDISMSFTDSQVRACQSETEFKRFEDCMTNSASIAKIFNAGFG
jgi:hypothetical protein